MNFGLDDYFWINVFDDFNPGDCAVYVLHIGADQTKIKQTNNLVFLGFRM